MTIASSPNDLAILKQAGRIHAEIMQTMAQMVQPDMTGIELNQKAVLMLKEREAASSFLGFDDYPAVLCVNVNDGIVHGIPNDQPFKAGDLVTVDLGVFYKGFHVDGAWTWGIAPLSQARQDFLKTGQVAHGKAIDQAVTGHHIGDISAAMQTVVEAAGYGVVRTLVGHGVGKALHEDPQVPCFGQPGRGLSLPEGLVLAIELMYSMGDSTIVTDKNDHWTMCSQDGSDTGLFEHSVVISNDGPVILTTL